MTILFDIGHPAHVHYFRNLIFKEKSHGNKVVVFARDKEVTYALLEYYQIDYMPRGKGGKNLLSKFFYMFWADLQIFKYVMWNKVDIFVSFASPYAAQIAWLFKKPHIALTDTENAPLGIMSFLPFSSVVLTPDCFKNNLGQKHIKFNSFMETSYIKGLFNKEKESINTDPYIVIRFVSWEANHDINQKGISLENKIFLVKELSKLCAVYISSESELPEELVEYRLNIHPALIHETLYNAELYIGEGATMASEAALMGTPAIYVNTLEAGTLSKQEENGLLSIITDFQEVYKKTLELLKNNNKETNRKKAKKVINSQIDITRFISWFINNYPVSYQEMKRNPKYQERFKINLT